MDVVPQEVVFQDHKCDGELVSIELRFSSEIENDKNRQICIVLDITFGEFEETFKNSNQDGYIRFGIKHGKLRLKLENGAIPLRKRLYKDLDEEWMVITTGTKESPVWEFEARGTLAVLRGARVDRKLGVIDISSTFCIVDASFNVSTSRTDIEITAQDGVWDDYTEPKRRETKIAAFFKHVIKPKLEDYLSKVILKYGSDTIS